MSEPSRPLSVIRYAAQTDIGMRRANNQDSLASLVADNPTRFNRRGHLFIVADGMGAHAAGELASQMAVERIPHYFLQDNSSSIVEALLRAISEANREVYHKGQSNADFHSMGTTVSAMVVHPDGVVVGHVGDSRVYRLRRGVLEQLTFDHSLAWEMEANGHVQPGSELSRAIPKNVITRSLGPSLDVIVDMEGPWPALQGDRYLLCSDGLTGQVEDEELGMLLGCLPPEHATQVLIDLANLRGGPDNVTVVVVQVEEDLTESSPPPVRPRRRRAPPPVLWVMVAASLILALLLGISGVYVGMVAALLVAAGVACYTAWYCLGADTGAESVGGQAAVPQGRGPYRRYSAKPTEAFVNRLASTIDSLREAASERGWQVEWDAIDRQQAEADVALKKSAIADAVRSQGEALLATMQQLRKQRSGNDIVNL